jgi:hypothetical protein
MDEHSNLHRDHALSSHAVGKERRTNKMHYEPMFGR